MTDIDAIRERAKTLAACGQAEGWKDDSLALKVARVDVPALLNEVFRLSTLQQEVVDETGATISMGDHVTNLNTRAKAAEAEVERLQAALDEAQLRSIEARNPGIDMDEVRRTRTAHVGGGA